MELVDELVANLQEEASYARSRRSHVSTVVDGGLGLQRSNQNCAVSLLMIILQSRRRLNHSPHAAVRRRLAAGCGWPVRTLTGCWVWRPVVVVRGTRWGVC